MIATREYYEKARGIVVRNPKLIVGISVFLFLVVFSGFEYVRASRYMGRTHEYRQSVPVMKAVDRVGRLTSVVDSQPNGLYCNLSVELLVEERFRTEASTVTPEKFAGEAGDYAKMASPAPGFNSFAQFVPKVREARAESVALTEAVREIQNLTREDARSNYCTELITALEEVYYVDTLSTTQGVNALHVAQQGNFINNVSVAQSKIRTMRVPDLFADEHVAVNEYLNELRLDLQNDATQYESFGRVIEQGTEQLEAVFVSIDAKSQDLSERAEQLQFYAAVLEP